MKKQILLAGILLTTWSTFAQSNKPKPQNYAAVDMYEKWTQNYMMVDHLVEQSNSNVQQSTTPNNQIYSANKTSTIAPINWQPLSASMNIFGMLVSNSKPLQYNDELGAVSFIHRKSPTYIPSPVPSPSAAASGAIVAMVSTNWGGHWDSTCIWNNNSQYARYPQGGIYNSPMSNTLITNAYVVGMGPVTQAIASTGWIGSWAASKKLDVLNDNVASTVPNAQQFISNTASLAPVTVGKIDFPRTHFTSTDDGVIRGLGRISANANGTTAVTINYTGANILKGTFNSGTFTWSGDAFTPSVLHHSAGYRLLSNAYMAWSESGEYGYVVFIGCDSSATGANRGYQPIIYKTSNYGTSWTTINRIDFNNPAFNAPVLDHIPSASNNTNVTIPQFNLSEGIDVIVDKNDRLHIVSTILGTFSTVKDSLGFTFSINNADGERYNYGHTPGFRPYIYDFYQTATNSWTVAVVDSMSTESPGTTSGSNGYNDNPWDADPTNNNVKQSSDARIQLSRTPDGNYIVYTWAESDTNITNSNHKWNHLPNIKARLMDVSAYTVHSVEINMTNQATGSNPYVASRAQMHYISPKCDYFITPTLTINGPVLRLPATVSNNQNVPLTQQQPNTHWYTSAPLYFGSSLVGIKENTFGNVSVVSIYPNPAKNDATITMQLNGDKKLEISIYNIVGQKVKTENYEGVNGENKVSLNLKDVSPGVYLVNISEGNVMHTKKLIVE